MRHRNESGFTLIELIIGMLITAIVVSGVANLVSGMENSTTASEFRTQETDQAEKIATLLETQLAKATCDVTYISGYSCGSGGTDTDIVLSWTNSATSAGTAPCVVNLPFSLDPPYKSDAGDLYFFAQYPSSTGFQPAPTFCEQLIKVWAEPFETVGGQVFDFLQMASNGVTQTIGENIVDGSLSFTYYTPAETCAANGTGTSTNMTNFYATLPAGNYGTNSFNTVGISFKVQDNPNAPAIVYDTCFFLTASPYA
ncbi:MAG: prepilin-type N-terminal cleavage/methylation domain-containing protein [Sulfobacillus sp.]